MSKFDGIKRAFLITVALIVEIILIIGVFAISHRLFDRYKHIGSGSPIPHWIVTVTIALLSATLVYFLMPKKLLGKKQHFRIRTPFPQFGGRVRTKDSARNVSAAWTSVRIFYATNRDQKVGESAIQYGNQRGDLRFGECNVTIPDIHVIGLLETPSIFRLQFNYDPKKHITLTSVTEQNLRAFYEHVADKVFYSERKEAFVFIHGYNVTFEDAARRTAQIAFDLQFDGAPILFSWPSAGKFEAYVKDETNIEWSIPYLEFFLSILAWEIGAATIHLIAHSMGNRALARVLKEWEQSTGPPPFKHVVLTAPDMDADTFKDLAATICLRARKLTFYTSHLDKALIASKKFHGYPRAGEKIVIVRGMDTIDASAVNTSFLGHSHFGASRSVIQDIHYLFKNEPVEKRFGIIRKESSEGIYYVFRP